MAGGKIATRGADTRDLLADGERQRVSWLLMAPALRSCGRPVAHALHGVR
jgi:hypothetical protein